MTSNAIKNVLFFSMEDLNDWIEPLKGHPNAYTPNLNRLAERSRLFEAAYAAAPACSPSRTSILFSRYPWSTGIVHHELNWHDCFPIENDENLIAQVRTGGFETLGFGKVFHNRFKQLENSPSDWSHFNSQSAEAYDIISQSAKDGVLRRRCDFGIDPNSTVTRDDLNADALIAKIKPGDTGKFWGFGTDHPHLPFVARQEFFDKIPIDVDLPPGLLGDTFDPDDKTSWADLPKAARKMARRHMDDGKNLVSRNEYKSFIRAYLASIAYADHILGRVLDHLENTGLLETTLIVFYSDHGWQFGEKLAFRKFSLWERSLRVPLMIAGPGITPGRCKTPVSLVDLAPSVLSLLGLKKPSNYQGYDLSQYLIQNEPIERSFVASIWGPPSDDGTPVCSYCLRTKRFRIIRYWNGSYEFYDHKTDPFEHHNLALHSNRNSFARLKNTIDQFVEEAERQRPETRIGPVSAELLEQRRVQRLATIQANDEQQQ
ncbi:MAG: sulfatase-like hydrolase/transferase [Planktotalea sp.]|uniref:sulfatase-like hydrolase/transferase n=1 Tax=Planktotalea sp. TaxID=2029877 RepID=UPI003C7714AF